MRCPKCGFLEDKVIDSRVTKEGGIVRRRRECARCANRFTTQEEIVPTEIVVVKRDQSREDFDPRKIREGVKRALWKRPVADGDREQLLRRICQRLELLGEREIPSAAIGEIAMAELRRLDEVAYVRFASVYRQFEDIGEFVKEIRGLTRKPKAND